MAASLLRSSFLCSGVDLKNLIGVADDVEENVLVTCKSSIKLYNAQDQKQIQSWSTKTWHQFTCTAVCDPSSKNIVAVINHSSVSQWNHSEDDIDKVKRENFKTSIHQLIVSGGLVYVIFTSGAVEDLTTALNSHKQPKVGCLEENETITYAAIDGDIAVLLVEDEEKRLKVWRINLSGGPPVCCNLFLKDASLTGICFLSSKLFTLWSNGNMHCLNFHKDPIEKLPGRVYSSVNSIDPSKRVKILPVASSHIALVGYDVNQEGSILLLWDVKFALVTSSRKLKMYHNPPLAWVTSVGIIIVDGGPLTRTPYVITDSTLATIFGSRVSKETEFPAEVCYGWLDEIKDLGKGETQTIYANKSEKLVEILRNLKKMSLSESMLADIVIDTLLEKKDLLLLHEVITVFEDIPEACLIKVIQCYLSCDDSSFDGLFKFPDMQMEVKTEEEVVKCPFGVGKASFINSVLARPYTDIFLTKELQKLSFDESLCLIQYFYFMILAGEALLCPKEDEQELSLANVSEWLSLLLDTKYHELIMTSQVDTHRLLLSCFTLVADMRNILLEMIGLEPLIKQVMEEEENIIKKENLSCRGYSLEKLVIKR